MRFIYDKQVKNLTGPPSISGQIQPRLIPSPFYTMLRRLFILPVLVVTVFAQDTKPRRLEVLFLGDDRGHKPLERYHTLKQVLGTRGYNLTFAEDLSLITRDNLDRYDSLIVYANHEQDKVPADIMGWVRDGGGLVALHSACGCFHPSPEWFKLVGGKFKSHEGHEFSPETVDKNHVITRGLPELKAWDETYVHQDLTADRHLLQVRPPINAGEKDPEPWTWTRSEGKGRVFYTASGHDERVWNDTAYHVLVARAINWSVGEAKAKQFAALKLPELVVKTPRVRDRAHPEIPMMDLQLPLSPADSAMHTQVPPGTRLELFASEPMVMNPIAIDWDERGRCWVVESFGYPNDVPEKPGSGDDKIKILTDTNGDGKADKMTVFAKGLRHCTTSVFFRGGVIATDGPDIVFLRDDNGDDVADTREVLATGLNMGDTHASTSHFLYGLDNWLYGTVGYSGVDMKLADGEHKFAQAVFRFQQDLSKLEYLQSTTNNTWGLGFSEDGTVYGSTANNNPSWMVSIPGKVYEGSGLEQPKTPRLDNQPFMYTNTRDITQVDQIEKYTAAAGHMFYTDEFFKGILPEKTAFICEPTGHIVATGTVTDRGSLSSIDMRGNNIFASADAWAAPVAARTGPDGAVWVADWYNPVIQHNVVFRFWNPARNYDKPHSPYQTGQKGPGKGNAYTTPLRDRKHGRIWRIVPDGEKLRKAPALSKKDPIALVRTLNSPSQHLRLHAQRLLIERGEMDVVPQLAELVTMAATPEGRDLPLGAYHALRTLGGLATSADSPAKQALIAALDGTNVGIRLQAMQSLDASDPALVAKLPDLLISATKPHERLIIFTTFAMAPPNEGLAAALWNHVKSHPNQDEAERQATQLAMRRQGSTLLGVALSGEAPTNGWATGELEEVARRVANSPNRPALAAIVEKAAPTVKDRFSKILGEAPATTEEVKELPAHLVAGRDAYLKTCVECHQADGKGVPATFPPLFDSEWVKHDTDTLLRIMLGGLMGPIKVKGEEFNSAMPGHSHSTDEEIAAVASYVRHAFGGIDEEPIKPEQVKALRPEVDERKFMPWTVKELPRPSK